MSQTSRVWKGLRGGPRPPIDSRPSSGNLVNNLGCSVRQERCLGLAQLAGSIHVLDERKLCSIVPSPLGAHHPRVAPSRSLYRSASSPNTLSTWSSRRSIPLACRRAANDPSLPHVTTLSARRRSSFALAMVVSIRSCSTSCDTCVRRRANLCAEDRPSRRKETRCFMPCLPRRCSRPQRRDVRRARGDGRRRRFVRRVCASRGGDAMRLVRN